MKAYIIVNVARQINGEFIFVRMEKAFKDDTVAKNYLNSVESNYKDLVQNSNGFSVECMCSRGFFEVEVEE
jgi:hypothetical protein